MLKMPPVEKVYEAWTAIADNRVTSCPDGIIVRSSDGAKEYTVKNIGDIYSADDNATYWQGYPGYPLIVYLMMQGRLPFDKDEAEKWKGINWNAINKKYKRNYALAVKEIAIERGIDMVTAAKKADKVMEVLSSLPIVIKRKIS